MEVGRDKPIRLRYMAVQYSIRGKGAVSLHFRRKAFRLGPS
jgi:hypothetical protein